jgi:hypothetical protein
MKDEYQNELNVKIDAAEIFGPKLRASSFLLAMAFIFSPFVAAVGEIFTLPRQVVALASLSLCGLIGVRLYWLGKDRYRQSYFPYASGYLLIFSFVMALSCVMAYISGNRTDTQAMWRQLVMALLPIVLYFGCQGFAKEKLIIRGLEWGVMALAIISSLSIGLEFFGLTNFEHYGGRYFGFLSDGSAWLVGFVCIVFLAQNRIVALLVMLCVLALTLSRGAILVFLVSVIIMVWGGMSGGSGSRRYMKAILFTLTFGAIVVFLVGSGQLNELISRVPETDIWDNDRVWTAKLSLSIFYESPFLGAGFNAQQYFFSKDEILLSDVRGFSTPTSTAMQVLADGGIMAFIPYMAFVVNITILSFKVVGQKILTNEFMLLRGLSAWLISFLWLNQTASWLLPGSYLSPILFAVAGLLVGATRESYSEDNGCLESA